MTLTKKEKTMLILLAVVVYVFVFVKFVLMSSIPGIKEVKNRIQTAQVQLDALEKDYRNINAYKKQIEEYRIIDDRLGEYLVDSAGYADSVEFVEELSRLMGAKLKSVSLGNPAELVEGNSTYYAFSVNFRTVLTEDGLNELLKFVEGGSRKITVSNLNITPVSHENAAEEYGIKKTNDQLFDVGIGLTIYSINKDAADSIAYFTRAAFERFLGDDDSPVFVENKDEVDISRPAENRQSSAANTRNTGTPAEITLMNADFKIFHTGYLLAGYNFEAYSEFNRSERIRYHVGVPVDVTLILGKTQYTIEYSDANGYTETLTGNMPEQVNRDYTLYIQSYIAADVKENENLWVNLRIRNDSGRNLVVKLEQKGDRVKLMDRNGNAIERRSDREKVYI